MPKPLTPPPPSVFLSYSHKDERWKDRLLTHLGIAAGEGLLAVWNDRQIGAGSEWREEIQKAIDAARVAVLLVSADFLTSQFIKGEEVPRFLERRAKDGLHVFPVIVRACDWGGVKWLSPIQARPQDGKPLAGFRGNRVDAELAAIAKEIREILGRDEAPKAAASAPAKTAPIAPALMVAAQSLQALHQIPAPPADFTGREAELAALAEAVGRGGATAIFGLRGMGGVGKTALALKLAERLEPLYPDAQIYLDLLGMSREPLTAAQAMAHVVRSFQPDARLPEGAAELAALYRSVLHGKRVFLLMDSAAGKEQAEPLLPPCGCALLVTSRVHFHIPGLVARDLDELPLADARALLERLAPRIGAEAEEISRLCGRLPLALRLAGSALAERPDLSVAAYTRRLAKGKERFGEVDAALSLSCELLRPGRATLWYALSVLTGTFDAAAAAAVWALEADPADEALGELGTSSLVEWEEKEERYRLHDLARLFAADQLKSVEKAAASRRHAVHYVEVLRQADSLYEQGHEGVMRGLVLFDREWRNVQAGQAWAEAHREEDPEAAALCSDYGRVGLNCLRLRLPPKERVPWLTASLAAVRSRKDRAAEGTLLRHVGNAYLDLGEHRRGSEFYEQGLAIARGIGDRRGEAGALGNLGLAYNKLGEPRRAIEFHKQHLDISREIGDRQGEAIALCNLGLAYWNLGEPRRAIEFHQQYLAISREIGHRQGEANALGSLGIAYWGLGEPRRAIEFHKQHLAISGEIGDRRGEAIASWNLGEVYEGLGDLARAAELMEVCVAYEREIGHPDAEADAAHLEQVRARMPGV
jgi:tetratricopeptide (TPR) repeat protein